jgi:hypothetical protein
MVAVSAAVTWAGAVAPAWPADARVSAVAGSWGRAAGVPGLAALARGGNAAVNAVSCGSPGDCAAGGYYQDRARHGLRQGFVAAERNGVWGKAIGVPGLAALNKQNGEVDAVSCASAGNCAAVGNYGDGHGHLQGFVAVAKNGVWGKAIGVPGLAALNKGRVTQLLVSCGSAGTCAAVGYYDDRQGFSGFVAIERDGVWGKAIQVPGLGALDKGDESGAFAVSCTPAGYCAVGGNYTGRDVGGQGYVAVEKNGRWGKAIEVPGLGTLNKGGDASVDALSCASAGNCVAGGNYRVKDSYRVFVAVEKNGVWERAVEAPGLAALDVGQDGIADADMTSVSCTSPGNCTAGGDYTDRHLQGQGFVAAEKDGVWEQGIEVPGLGTLNRSGDAGVISVSCASTGNCAAVGYYTDQHEVNRGFVAVEKNGQWGRAIEVPGLGALNPGGDAQVFSVSCAQAGACAAGGYYTDRHDHSQGFIVNHTG